MKDTILWLFNDPWHYAAIVGFATFVLGYLIGHTAKTSKYEIGQREAERKLHIVLATIELKRAEPLQPSGALVTAKMSEGGLG